jgi:hypothetical protein
MWGTGFKVILIVLTGVIAVVLTTSGICSTMFKFMTGLLPFDIFVSSGEDK